MANPRPLLANYHLVVTNLIDAKELSKIFGAKRDEVAGEWRNLHNAALYALYSSPDIIGNVKSRSLRWAGHVARTGESRNAYIVLVGRPEGKRTLGRPRRRWEDNINMDLTEVGCDDKDWINLAQDRDQWRAYLTLQVYAYEMCRSKKCDTLITFLIGFYILVIAFDHYSLSEQFKEIIYYSTIILLVTFSMEVLVKVFAFRHYYFKDLWNIFDLTIVVTSITGLVIRDRYLLSLMTLRAVRVAKMRRVLRHYKIANEFIKCVLTLSSSLTSVLSVCFIFMIVMFLYAIFGMTFFARNNIMRSVDGGYEFKTFGQSMVTLFQMTSSNHWNGMLEAILAKDACREGFGSSCVAAITGIAFVLSYTFITYVLVCLILAVVLYFYSSRGHYDPPAQPFTCANPQARLTTLRFVVCPDFEQTTPLVPRLAPSVRPGMLWNDDGMEIAVDTATTKYRAKLSVLSSLALASSDGRSCSFPGTVPTVPVPKKYYVPNNSSEITVTSGDESESLSRSNERSRHRKDFNFHAPSNHVRFSSTNFIQRSSKYNIKNNENSVTAAVGSSEQAPTFRLLSRSRNIPCATRYCEPATAGQVSSSESEHCYFGTGGPDLLFIFATVPRESEHTLCNAVLRARNSWASEQLGVGTLLFRNRRFRPTVHFCNSSETGTVPK
ncbi:hypothetical protein ANN_04427 [Periplaneta americana]|uniref:Ion transport domain-containing protein n=1 Tax=Periplaneta americana TaxID=6978 RepID=A0ABQ8TA33_PERAM|nr:hypothetical protein ANN_04427 [Periplaneta americana]